MAVDFNAKFEALNTNRTGDSANILDKDEVKAALEAAGFVIEGVSIEGDWTAIRCAY